MHSSKCIIFLFTTLSSALFLGGSGPYYNSWHLCPSANSSLTYTLIASQRELFLTSQISPGSSCHHSFDVSLHQGGLRCRALCPPVSIRIHSAMKTWCTCHPFQETLMFTPSLCCSLFVFLKFYSILLMFLIEYLPHENVHCDYLYTKPFSPPPHHLHPRGMCPRTLVDAGNHVIHTYTYYVVPVFALERCHLGAELSCPCIFSVLELLLHFCFCT